MIGRLGEVDRALKSGRIDPSELEEFSLYLDDVKFHMDVILTKIADIEKVLK